MQQENGKKCSFLLNHVFNIFFNTFLSQYSPYFWLIIEWKNMLERLQIHLKENSFLTLSGALFSWIRGPKQPQCSLAPCPSWWSSPLIWPLPSYFLSHTVQIFQRERPFPPSKTEAPFYLGLVVPSLCPNKILPIRPTHEQWTHINPHEKSSLVNCSLSPTHWVFCSSSSIHGATRQASEMKELLPHSCEKEK